MSSMALDGLDPVDKAEAHDRGDGTAVVHVLPSADRSIVEPVNARLRSRGIAVDELAVEQGRLDEVFRALTLAQTAPQTA